MPAAERARHRNGGQHVFLVNTLFWKILVTRVKRKMREGKIRISLRELTAANPANQPPRSAHPTPPRRERRGDFVTRTGMSETLANARTGNIGAVVNAYFR